MHLEDAERPLHQRVDPPVMEIREDAARAQPAIRQDLVDGENPST
jgi:hypothetical protein